MVQVMPTILFSFGHACYSKSTEISAIAFTVLRINTSNARTHSQLDAIKNFELHANTDVWPNGNKDKRNLIIPLDSLRHPTKYNSSPKSNLCGTRRSELKGTHHSENMIRNFGSFAPQIMVFRTLGGGFFSLMHHTIKDLVFMVHDS